MSTLKDLERQREQLQGQKEAQFAGLGKFVYEHFRKEEIDAVVSMMKSVDELDVSIAEVDAAICQKKEELQQKLDEMHRRGLMICPNCQAEISDKSIFCNICGTRVEGLAGELTAETEAEAEPEPEEAVEAEAEVAETEVEAEQETETETEVEAEPETEEAAEAEAEPETEEAAETEAEPETEAEAEPEIVPEPSIDLDAYSDAVVRQVEEETAQAKQKAVSEIQPEALIEEETVSTPVQQKPARICRKCGKPIGDGYLFCIYCGTKYEEAQPTPQQTTSTQGVCPKCGMQNKAGYLFCIRCGTKLS